MDSNTTDSTPVLALVTNIADARKARTAKDEEADLEVSGPQAIKLQGDEWMISACDGEQVYVWVARKKTKRSKGYTIFEVYPGLAKKRTALRNARVPKDLEMKHPRPLTTLSDVLEDLEGIVFEDIEDDGEEGVSP